MAASNERRPDQEMKPIFTGCFFHAQTAPGRISIARRAPKAMSNLPSFPELAPGPWFKQVDEHRYRQLYFREILGPLDPMDVHTRLCNLAEAIYGEGVAPILLCWERRPDTDPSDWCHRRMVAEWFADALGLDVPEIKAAVASVASPPKLVLF